MSYFGKGGSEVEIHFCDECIIDQLGPLLDCELAVDIDLLYTVFLSSVAQGMPKYSPELSCLHIPGLGKLRMKSLSDFDFFRICVAAFHRTPRRESVKSVVRKKKTLTLGRCCFPT